MTDEAAAAFLKTLEEPPAGVVFILLADREEKLSPTILSRCQRIIFPETEFGRTMQSASGDFCEAMNSIRQKKINELLNLSTGLEKERENIEEVLYDLAYYAHQKLAETRSARIVLDAVRKIKRKANLRLTLDVMCLSLGGAVKNAQ
jgi:DNA polymerase III gamma/tau subunit